MFKILFSTLLTCDMCVHIVVLTKFVRAGQLKQPEWISSNVKQRNHLKKEAEIERAASRLP